MHLFGDASGPHMAHFHVEHHKGCVELEWEVRNVDTILWRVLRSERGFADTAEPPGTSGQVRVSEGQDTYLRDEGLDPHRHYYYTVFSQEPDGSWQRQVEAKARAHEGLDWLHPEADEKFAADLSRAETGAGDPRPIDATLLARAAATARIGCLRIGH